jgi:hypothetical protein
LWEISPKCEFFFEAATPTKGFFGKFLKRFAQKAGFLDWIARFRTSTPAGHQTAAGLQFFSLSYLSCSQILLDPPVDVCQCGYTSKEKKTLVGL